MERKSFLAGLKRAGYKKLAVPLLLISALAAGCRILAGTAGLEPNTREPVILATSSALPANTAVAPESLKVLAGDSWNYCFSYPEGYTEIITAEQVEIAGPVSEANPHPGLVWVERVDAQGRSAQEIADQEVNELGGSPPQSTVLLGGEEALVLDGMPGQDPIRKLYIVHDGLLYTLNFSPYQSEYPQATAQMETLFRVLTSSWVWLSAGQSCPLNN